MLVVLGADGHVRTADRGCCEVLGIPEDELVGSDWFDAAVPPGERGDAREAFRRVVADPSEHDERFEGAIRTRAGEQRVVAWRSVLLRDATGAVAAVVRSAEEHRSAAAHDTVTGLPNAALLVEHLALAVARARRQATSLALLRLNLEGFGLINDSLGAEAGDAIVRDAALRLRAVTRASDLLARTGSDEFVLMLSDVRDAPADAATVVSRLVGRSLAEPFRVGPAELELKAAVGIAVHPDHADNADDLLRCAGDALEQARRRGSAAAVFESGADATAARARLSLAARLRRAVERDELVLHFQPLVRPGDARLVGAEALVRWHDPESGGLVPPGDFIPVAEQTGVIGAIGEWVVDALCRQVRDWRHLGVGGPEGLRLSFNLSPRELRRPDLGAAIIDRVASYGVDPGTLCVELTESTAIEHGDRTGALLRDLDAAGFHLAIDDFGAGHSSLARLRDLPVHILKIDRSFIGPVPQDPQAAAIVAAVLALGRALGMTTVAEGVETAQQRAFLVEHGCPLAQGWLFGRPVPADELAVRLRADARRD